MFTRKLCLFLYQLCNVLTLMRLFYLTKCISVLIVSSYMSPTAASVPYVKHGIRVSPFPFSNFN